MIERLCVAGLGKLGSPIAASFAVAGVDVTGYDLDVEKVSAINRGLPPVDEPGLAAAIKKAWTVQKLRATTDAARAVEGTQACIFITPTPSLPDGQFDNKYLTDALTRIAQAVHVAKIAPYYFIIASTVTPGSCDKEFIPLLQTLLGDIESEPVTKGRFHLIYKPELIALGTVMRDLADPDVALVGAQDSTAGSEVFNLYSRLYYPCLSPKTIETTIMSLVEAELAKISLNCAITMKISFANQISMVAERLGADARKILHFVGSDSRIGRKALRPGMPFGGPCFPRDNRMFQYVAEKVSVEPHLASATYKINEDVLQYILGLIPQTGDIGILGIAYKAGTTVIEESAGLMLRDVLLIEKREVKIHDPLLFPNYLKDVLDCHTIIVTMDSREYRELRFRSDQFVIDPMGIAGKTK